MVTGREPGPHTNQLVFLSGPPARPAEEAVNEVKRQAMTELQKAVSEAERKAHDMITSERAKMERTVAEAKRQAAEDALAVINQQEDSSEVRRPRARLPPKAGFRPRVASAPGWVSRWREEASRGAWWARDRLVV